MKTPIHHISNANQAVAHIAYKTNEFFPIYPITPSSEMSELVEQWSAEGRRNCFDHTPSTFQMQSEAGVAGTMHGALQTGTVSSTFTASQGLLLMLPNMYKIAGELTPNVIHVATRSISTHALSIFGDHSDIMAVRQSGYAFLGSASVQEAQDLALIAQASTLASKIPFVHFFDGFRTSHESSTIEHISDEIILSMIDNADIDSHRERALTSKNPVIRGTSQGSDVFFQSREASNSIYDTCPLMVQEKMDQFAKLTGRHYKLFDYVGSPEAEHIIISMASSTETIETTINQLNDQGEKLGLIKVRLFRPFSTQHLLEALPESVKTIAVLDRTKECGASGEPLYLDIVQSLSEAYQKNDIATLPKIVGGRYGLSSKEFTPSMVLSIVKNLKRSIPISNFTVGINDDVTHLSLDYSEKMTLNQGPYEAVFYNKKAKFSTTQFQNTLDLIGQDSNAFIQGFTEIGYKKSNTIEKSHLRIDAKHIRAPYLISEADFVACEGININSSNSIIDSIKPKGILLVDTLLTSKAFWQSLSGQDQYQLIEKNVNLYTVNSDEIYQLNIIEDDNISVLNACFLSLRNDVIDSKKFIDLTDFIYKVDTSVGYNHEELVEEFDETFSNSLLGKLLINQGHTTPISLLPIDGTYMTNTSEYNAIQSGDGLPEWHPDLCTQCGACSMACPQSALRIKVFEDQFLKESPKGFKSTQSNESDWKTELLNYSIQINPEQCNSCNNCIDACPAKALVMKTKNEIHNEKTYNWAHFESIPEFDRGKINVSKVSQQQLQEPLFKYSIGVEGCGEAPYLKLVSQLFGDRLLIANATGASSIFGGALPTTPWSKNKDGLGPAWSNSLFEDNAEFGLGYRLSIDQKEQQAKTLLKKLLPQLDFDLVHDILNADQSNDVGINEQRLRISVLKNTLISLNHIEAKALFNITDCLIKESVWVIGGDGWAYDIGYGGLDHVMASGRNVNILVLDNEVYDNTGGQSSKATPFGAKAKFDFGGKRKQKKDLGMMAMNYDNVYVASVSIGADQEHTLRAFNEAESFDGPSIIIAYCHSDAHGIDMKNPSQYHKAAVNSGQWLLYRNDPRRAENGLNPMQLDSQAPTIYIEEYLKMENRFKNILHENSLEIRSYIKEIQDKVNNRFDRYLLKAVQHVYPRKKVIQNIKMLDLLKNK